MSTARRATTELQEKFDDLTQEVGIGKGTIYLHFRSKEEIVLSHVDRIVERVPERLVPSSPAPARRAGA